MTFSLSIILVIITVGVSIYAFSNDSFMRKGIMNAYLTVEKKQYLRLISSGFLHGSYLHLGFNMFTFYFFGPVVESVFTQLLGSAGPVIFILYYLTAIAISDLPVAIKQRHNIGYNSLGASGAVSAMVFTSILYFPLNDLCIYGIFCLPGFIIGVLYIVYSYFQGKNMSDNINHEAHLYGALYGLVVGILVYPDSVSEFFRQVTSYRIF